MAGAKEIRGKIASIKNTQKITKAMEMVAASKMRKAQDRMRAARRPFAQRMLSPRTRENGHDAAALALVFLLAIQTTKQEGLTGNQVDTPAQSNKDKNCCRNSRRKARPASRR